MNIKILVGYHKPAYLFKNDVLVPIHCGRDVAMEEGKDGKISDEDLKWLEKNTIGDNTGENISSLNRRFCELTALYWAWKNYDKLGNPDYIGFMHYRRIFCFNEKICGENFKDYWNLFHLKYPFKEFMSIDKLSPEEIKETVAKHKYIFSVSDCDSSPYYWRANHKIVKKDDFLKCLDIASKIYPNDHNIIKTSLNENKHVWSNLFIMPKNTFFAYCEWIFPILFELDKKIDYSGYSIAQQRTVAYCAETLMNVWVAKINKEIKSFPIVFFENTDTLKPQYMKSLFWFILYKLSIGKYRKSYKAKYKKIKEENAYFKYINKMIGEK